MEYEEKEPDDNKSVSNNSMHSVQGRRQRFARYIELFLDKYCIIKSHCEFQCNFVKCHAEVMN